MMQLYRKMNQMTDEDRFSPTFIHRLVSIMVLELLGGGLRESEAIFVHVLSGPEAAQTHRTLVLVYFNPVFL